MGTSKGLKLYINYDGQRGPEHTFVWREESGSNSRDTILSAFVADYIGKHQGVELCADSLRLCLDSGESFPSGDVRKLMKDGALSNGADVSVVEKSKAESSKATPRTNTVQKPDKVAQPQPSSRTCAQHPTSLVASDPQNPAIKAVIEQSIEAASKCMAAGKLRRAREIWEQVLQFDPKNQIAMRGCAKILYDTQRWEKARLLYEAILPYGVTPQQAEDLLQVGRLRLMIEDVEGAELALSCALQSGADINSVEVLMGSCALVAGRTQEAADFFQRVLARTKERHLEALVCYASLALRLGQLPSALQPLLKAIVVDQSHKDARRLLATVLTLDGGLEALWVQVPASEHSASVYAFLGTVARDFSSLPAAQALHTKSLNMCPHHPTYALNLTHLLEVRAQVGEALAAAKLYLAANVDSRVGNKGVKSSDILQVLSSVESVDSPLYNVHAQWRIHWITEKGSEPISYAYCTPHSTDKNTQNTTCNGESAHAETNGEVSSTEGQRLSINDDEREEYSPESLDLLALHFTIVKLLYISGALAVIPSIVRLLEPTRLRSATQLHRTSVRNEQAYYTCIAQLLSLKPAEPASLLPQSKGSPIYICGDSHTLPPVWNVVNFKGELRMLTPALVTGLKHWHLRPESDFYPKANFYAAVRQLPQKVTVVFVFGEIDCREGLLVAVEKARYESIEEGIDVSVSHFIRAACAVVQTKNFDAYVHPVIPVLDATRPVVRAYNTRLRAAVEKVSPALKWLDMFDPMLEARSGKLRPEFGLDGTHLRPRPAYLALFEGALNCAAGSMAKCMGTLGVDYF